MGEPRERLAKYGPEALSNAELLAIISADMSNEVKVSVGSLNASIVESRLILIDELVNYLEVSPLGFFLNFNRS
ncbi:MAG: UPF0758 domain-containing protein [Candidatus Methanospirareceae archaeon]